MLIDFGAGVFTGETNWLQIGVATNGVSSFTLLTPRQQLTPTPYAIFANTASNLSGSGGLGKSFWHLWQPTGLYQWGQQLFRQRRKFNFA